MKQKALLSSILTIVLCVSLIAGSTFALFTSEEQVDIAVTAGGVELRAFIRNESVKTYWCGTPVGNKGMFINGGTAKIQKENLILNNMLPGDRADVLVDVLNESNVRISYRVVMTVEGKLGEVLVAKATSDDMTSTLDRDHPKSEWITANPGEEIAPITVSVELPTTVGNEYKRAPGQVTLTVEAIQETAQGKVFYRDVPYSSVQAALDAAEAGVPAVLEISGRVEWSTGAQYGNTPFRTNASEIIFRGLEYAELVAVGSGVGEMGSETVPVTYENLTLVDESVSYNESAWELGYLELYGKSTFRNVIFTDGIMLEGEEAVFENCTFTGRTLAGLNMYAAWVSNGNATFRDCSFGGTRGLKLHEDYGTDLGAVTVERCTFGPLSQKPGIAIGTLGTDGNGTYVGSGGVAYTGVPATVTVKDCTFDRVQAGDQGLYLYESDTAVGAWLTLSGNTVK